MAILRNEKKIRISIDGAAVLLICALGNPLARGEGGTEVTFSGTVFDPPPCKINGNHTIDFAFSSVGVKKGGQQKLCSDENVDLQLRCRHLGTTKNYDTGRSIERGERAKNRQQ